MADLAWGQFTSNHSLWEGWPILPKPTSQHINFTMGTLILVHQLREHEASNYTCLDLWQIEYKCLQVNGPTVLSADTSATVALGSARSFCTLSIQQWSSVEHMRLLKAHNPMGPRVIAPDHVARPLLWPLREQHPLWWLLYTAGQKTSFSSKALSGRTQHLCLGRLLNISRTSPILFEFPRCSRNKAQSTSTCYECLSFPHTTGIIWKPEKNFMLMSDPGLDRLHWAWTLFS